MSDWHCGRFNSAPEGPLDTDFFVPEEYKTMCMKLCADREAEAPPFNNPDYYFYAQELADKLLELTSSNQPACSM